MDITQVNIFKFACFYKQCEKLKNTAKNSGFGLKCISNQSIYVIKDDRRGDANIHPQLWLLAGETSGTTSLYQTHLEIYLCFMK